MRGPLRPAGPVPIPARGAGSRGEPASLLPAVPWLVAAIASWAISGEALAAAGIAVLWFLWRSPGAKGEIPVVPLCLTLQWAQITAGIYYEGLAGRRLYGTEGYAWRPAAWVGLTYLVVLETGLSAGRRIAARWTTGGRRLPVDLPLRNAAALYVGFLLLGAPLQLLAWRAQGLTQQLLAVGMLRLVFLFLLLRRLVGLPRGVLWAALVVLLETALALGEFWSSWKIPLLFSAVLAIDRIHARRSAVGYATLGFLAAVFVLFGAVWMGVRTQFRAEFASFGGKQERVTRLVELIGEWWGEAPEAFPRDMDRLAGRVWGIEYPALVMERVPARLPHEEGERIEEALRHVLVPRLLDPNKPLLVSDSEKVRRYAGVWVAGEEMGTSVGLSFVAEAYIDFGIPRMFLPLFLYGLLWGVCYRILLGAAGGGELASGLACVFGFATLAQFEVPWTKVLGGTLNLTVVFLLLAAVASRLQGRRRAPAAPRGPGRP